jgi:hypothetical protein
MGVAAIHNTPIVYFSAQQLKNLPESVFDACPNLKIILTPLAVANTFNVLRNSSQLKCFYASFFGYDKCCYSKNTIHHNAQFAQNALGLCKPV